MQLNLYALTVLSLTTVSFNVQGFFIMFSVITNIYNNKTKGPTLMELFTATGKLKKFFYTSDAQIEHLYLSKKKLFQFSCGFGFLVINVCDHGEHYEKPCICVNSP
jgi:dimeric dUTPase (all-alpha-NTP-PPase superfamily)